MEKKDAADGMGLGFEIPEEERTPTVDQLLRIIIEQRQEIARLREEINRLKGVPPQPQRKPSMLGQDEPPRSDTSKKSRRKKRKGKRPGSDKRKKTSELRIDDIVPCVPESLPDGAVRVSYRDWVVQDLVIRSHNVCYRREIYQLPDGSFIAGELPVHVAGHFGATLRSYVLYQHYQNHVTQPLILEELRDLAVDISAGQIDRLLHQGHEAFFQEKASLLPAAREVSQYFHTDNTSARHRCKNGHTTVISKRLIPKRGNNASTQLIASTHLARQFVLAKRRTLPHVVVIRTVTSTILQGGPPWKYERIHKTARQSRHLPTPSERFKYRRKIALTTGLSSLGTIQTALRTSNNKSISIIAKVPDNW